jgi:hypothetical protein
MKTKHFFNAVMAAFIAVIFSALAGCGTTPQAGGGQSSGGSGTEDGGAAQLAADLGEDLGKALSEDLGFALSKAVSGDIVTLTGRVEPTTALTVPEGVTLDLTADGAALELQDGAVLTVNGTVNATGHGDHGKGWVEGSLRIGNGAAVINGNGTIRLASKGRLLNIGSREALRQLTLDGVTLVGLENNDASLVEVREGGELVLKSGAITGNSRTDPGSSGGAGLGGGVFVSGGSTFTMEGGTISGNSAVRRGGGVANAATFMCARHGE